MGSVFLFRRALAIDENALEPDHPSTKQVRRNLNALIEAQKNKEK